MLLIVILVLAVPSNSQHHLCTKYTVRLDRNSSSSAGRFQICWCEGSSRLQWYSVCTVPVLNDDAVAAVVCRQLGFNTGSQGTFG